MMSRSQNLEHLQASKSRKNTLITATLLKSFTLRLKLIHQKILKLI